MFPDHHNFDGNDPSRDQLPPSTEIKEKKGVVKLLAEAKESDLRSYGVVVNSFYEIQKVYADHSMKVLGRKSWHIGPLSLCNKDKEEKARREKEASIDEHECLKWLDTKKSNSVVHVCFGSTVKFKRGWAPQVLILEHEAIGVFVTHCRWNSSLEAVIAGVPMITWPMGADQIFDEKLVTEVLKIGVPIGATKLVRLEGDCITCDAVEEAMKKPLK